MTGQRSTGTRRPLTIPPWWQLLIAITALAVLVAAGLVAATLAGQALLGLLAGSSYLILIVGAHVLSTPYPELRDHDCTCGPGAHHPSCGLRGAL